MTLFAAQPAIYSIASKSKMEMIWGLECRAETTVDVM
jgi:hypothetical protein